VQKTRHFSVECGLSIIAGIGLSYVGAAGLVGKEAYCFAWREGWLLMWLYAIMVFANLMAKEKHDL
jgi:uncharacterized integral membrane protein